MVIKSMTIADNLQTLIYCKADMKAAIEERGVTVSGGLSTYADAIREIDGNTIISDFDFSGIGYNDELTQICNNDIAKGISYAKTILNKWDNTKTNLGNKFFRDQKLIYLPLIDTSNVTSMHQTFCDCHSLTTVPLLDTSNVTEMSSTFRECSALRYIPKFNTSKVTNMYYMFCDCHSLTTVPLLDTSNVTSFEQTFRDCDSLTTVPQFNTSKVTSMYITFGYCDSLTTVPLLDASKVTNAYGIFTDCTRLTNVGGLKNLGAQESLRLGNAFYNVKGLTHDSIMNIINNLYDRKSAGYSVITLQLGSTNLKKITDEEKAIATNKGWTLT